MAVKPDHIKQLLKREVRVTWRYLFNLRPVLAYRRSGHSLDGEAARVVAALDRDGVAVTSVDALFGSSDCFGELAGAADALERSGADQLAAARLAIGSGAGIKDDKDFVVPLLGDPPVLDPAAVWARFALAPESRGVANAYYGMATQVRDYNVWHTFASDAPPTKSQLWHRDKREDHFILKAFVYLTDVGPGNGPFTYAPGTHAKGRRRLAPDTFQEFEHHRATDEGMAACLPREEWVEVTGRAGTMIFADTTGWHRGGYARAGDRILYTCLYASQACRQYRRMRKPPHLRVDDPDTAFALDLA